MIILDTIVISETQKEHPSPRVMSFLDRLDPTTTYLTSINVSEVLTGIELLPDGQRKNALRDAAFKLFHHTFKGRILPFDLGAASLQAQESCPHVSLAERMIASIAKSKGAKVATRNVLSFEAMHIDVVNPWEFQIN